MNLPAFAVACALSGIILMLSPAPSGATPGEIHQGPMDHVTQTGQNVTFLCSASGLVVRWQVYQNGSLCRTCNEDLGFWSTKQWSSSVVMMTLTVLANAQNNNTRVVCEAFIDQADTASAVLVVQGPPSPPILSLQPVSTTLMRLTLQEPFSWPEFPILSYHISWNNYQHTISSVSLTNGSVTVEVPKEANEECQWIKATAIAHSELGASQPSVAEGGFPVYPGPFTSPVNSTVLFRPDGSPIVTIRFELPHMCDYQELNYTIIATPTSEDTLAEPVTLGPKPYHYSNGPTVEDVFESGFVADEEYSVMVMVEVEELGTSRTSGNYSANTGLDQKPTNSHENVTTVPPEADTPESDDGGSVDITLIIIGVVVGALLLVVVVSVVMAVLCLCNCRADLDKPDLIVVARPAMVPNPIYEGSPVYETIDPKIRPLRPSTRTEPHIHLNMENETDESRYLDNPVNSTLGRDEVPIGKGSPDLKTIVFPSNGISPYGDAQAPAEDPYTIMSPAGRPTTLGPAGQQGNMATDETH